MEKVTGIGGIFFHSENHKELENWYEQNLGIRKCSEKYEDGSWWQDEGPTLFGPESTKGFGRIQKPWRINFRVNDLNAMVEQLRAAGILVTLDPEIYPNGRFAHLEDPEGNSIELWENSGTDATRPA